MAARKKSTEKRQSGRGMKLVSRGPTNAGALFARVREILEQSRGRVVREVNHATVAAYWRIGREIVNATQRGARRAQYGERALDELSQRLSER